MSEDKYAPRIGGTKQEKTGGRPSEYSMWHRGLGKEYLAVDIDFVEYRVDRGVVALIDVTGEMEDKRHIINSTRYIRDRTNVQREVLSSLGNALNVPAFLVLHTKDLSLFYVFDLRKDVSMSTPTKMSRNEYESFIKKL